MKNKYAGLLVIIILLTLTLCIGCSDNKEQERQQLITQQLNVLEKEIDGMEAQQTKLKESLSLMREQLDVMDQEVNRMSPRVFAAKGTLSMLRSNLFNNNSSLGWLFANLEFSIYLLVLLLVVWLLYRLRNNAQATDNS